MSVLRLAAFAALSSLACSPSAAQASACWYPEESRAAQVRGLQTMLMVGTLQCRHRSRLSEDLYTDFILSQRGVLDANGAILKARFTRENGVGGDRAYDRFGTRLANQYSERLDDPDFCATVHRLARLAAGASERELLRLADTVAEPPVSGECRPAQYYHQRPMRENSFARYEASRAALPPPRIAVADAIEPVPASGSVSPAAEPKPVEVAAAADAAVTARKLERVLEATSSAPPAVPAQAKVQPAARDEALKVAIVALQSAVAALQAASAAEPAPPEPAGTAAVEATAADPGTVNRVEVPGAGTAN